MKLRLCLVALIAVLAVAVGSSQATVSNISVTLDEASPYASVAGQTLFYAPTASNSGSFTVTVSASTTGSLTSADFPALTGMTGGGSDSTSPYQGTYGWTASTTASGPFDVTVHDSDPSSLTAVGAFTVTPDTTPPSGQTVSLSGGPNYTTLSVPLTLFTPSPGPSVDAGAGLDPASGELWRATAPLSGGTCGSFAAAVKIQGPAALPASFADTTVTTGNCYQYTYKISDLVGNQSTSPASGVAKVSTVGPTVTDTAPTEVNGANDQYWNSVSDTLFFRPAVTGSFRLNANAVDSTSGITQVAFPDVSAVTGWAGSTGGVDSSSPYSSPVTYAWTAGAAAPGAKQVVATNGTGSTAADTITISADATAPTGQSVALSGGPWFTGSVALTVAPGSDAGAGVDASRAVVERASATLTNGACGTFGTFAAVGLSSGTDATVAGGNCYRYQAKATDNVGNVSTASVPSADAKIDKTGPTTPSLLFTGLSNTAADGTVVYFRPGGGGQFTVTAAATDVESGIASFTFPNIPGASSVGSGPHRTYVFTNLTTALGPFTVTAQNAAGMGSAAATFTLAPDATAPELAVRCNGAACSSSPYAKAVKIALAATDAGGSGVGTIRWTVDGTDPTIDHGNKYQGTFSVESSTRLKARAFDKAGNPSALLAVTVKSLASRLLFAAPATAVVAHESDHLRARMASNRRALVRATMTGPGLKRALHWNFILPPGASIVQLRLPEKLKRPGTYRVVWTAVANVRKAQRTTRVTLKK